MGKTWRFLQGNKLHEILGLAAGYCFVDASKGKVELADTAYPLTKTSNMDVGHLHMEHVLWVLATLVLAALLSGMIL